MSQRREDGAAGDRETQRRARPGGLGSGEHATRAAGAGDLELTDGRPVEVGLTPRTPLDLPPGSSLRASVPGARVTLVTIMGPQSVACTVFSHGAWILLS